MTNWQEQQKQVATGVTDGSRKTPQTEALKLALEQIKAGSYECAMDQLEEALAEQSNEQVERTPLEQYDLEQSIDYRKGYEDGRLKGFEVGQRYAKEAYTHPPAPTAQPKEPEQEPVGEVVDTIDGAFKCEFTKLLTAGDKLYITPPQRKPLTREQRIQILKDNTVQGYHGDYFDAWGIIDDVEAAHGIKE